MPQWMNMPKRASLNHAMRSFSDVPASACVLSAITNITTAFVAWASRPCIFERQIPSQPHGRDAHATNDVHAIAYSFWVIMFGLEDELLILNRSLFTSRIISAPASRTGP